jgi:hypothetical protein
MGIGDWTGIRVRLTAGAKELEELTMNVDHTLGCEEMVRALQRTQQMLVSAVGVRRRLERIVGDLRSRDGSNEAPESGWRCWY